MYSFRYSDPKLAGVIVREAVRCGKRNCRCAQGRPHRWYYYLYYRVPTAEGWKLKKEYVPRDQVRVVRKKIRAAKAQDRMYKLQMEEMCGMLRDIEAQLRRQLRRWHECR